MSVPILVDTAPLVGLFNWQDQHHEKAKQLFAKVKPPLFTTWPVLTEAAWLLRKDPTSVIAFLELVVTGYLKAIDLDDLAAKRLGEILTHISRLVYNWLTQVFFILPNDSTPPVSSLLMNAIFVLFAWKMVDI